MSRCESTRPSIAPQSAKTLTELLDLIAQRADHDRPPHVCIAPHGWLGVHAHRAGVPVFHAADTLHGALLGILRALDGAA